MPDADRDPVAAHKHADPRRDVFIGVSQQKRTWRRPLEQRATKALGYTPTIPQTGGEGFGVQQRD